MNTLLWTAHIVIAIVLVPIGGATVGSYAVVFHGQPRFTRVGIAVGDSAMHQRAHFVR